MNLLLGEGISNAVNYFCHGLRLSTVEFPRRKGDRPILPAAAARARARLFPAAIQPGLCSGRDMREHGSSAKQTRMSEGVWTNDVKSSYANNGANSAAQQTLSQPYVEQVSLPDLSKAVHFYNSK